VSMIPLNLDLAVSTNIGISNMIQKLSDTKPISY
jgi:hypothetical protein